MIEVEVKALVNNINDLKSRTELLYPNATIVDSNQLNHYFSYTGEAIANLTDILNIKFKHDLLTANKLAVRTRHDDKQGTLLIFKYDTEDAENGTVRKEKEIIRPGNLYDLDAILLSCGLSYQSKWSRVRREYKTDKFNICVDINAGYGGLCEVEVMIDDESKKTRALKLCRSVLTKLGLTELDSELLDKMFKFYSNNYEYYYGTNKLIFDNAEFQELIK